METLVRVALEKRRSIKERKRRKRRRRSANGGKETCVDIIFLTNVFYCVINVFVMIRSKNKSSKSQKERVHRD